VLIFIGLKMLFVDFVHIPIGIALAIVIAVLAVAIVASLIVQPRKRSGPGHRQ
jgi:predicted tellurium resistance membrane protein TerC